MTFNCELFPRHDATPDELKRLGTAMKAWFDDFLEAHPDADGFVAPDALADLRAGELPKPFLLRCLGSTQLHAKELKDALERARAEHSLLHRCLPPLHGRCVPFGFWLADANESELLTSLRSSIPMELVESLRINGAAQ
jgi:hypothetical protein